MSTCYGLGGVPDFCQDNIREDFEAIWSRNVIQVALIRNNPEPLEEENADFFGTTNPRRKKIRLIELNIQPQQKTINREDFGVTDLGFVLSAFAKYDVDVRLDDRIKIIKNTKNVTCSESLNVGDIFKIQNIKTPLLHGQFAWVEFDLVKVDHE